MRLEWLKLGLLVVVWGTSSFASTDSCYADYDQAFRNPDVNPAKVSRDYQECLNLKRQQDRQREESEKFSKRGESQSHGHGRGQNFAEEETPDRFPSIPKTAARSLRPDAGLDVPLSVPRPRETSNANSNIEPACVGSSYTYIGANGRITCNAAANNAVAMVGKFHNDREGLMRGFLGEIARNERRN